jgi:hypothetical protein
VKGTVGYYFGFVLDLLGSSRVITNSSFEKMQPKTRGENRLFVLRNQYCERGLERTTKVIFVVFVCCSKHRSTKPGRNQLVPPTIALVLLQIVVPTV